MHYAHRTDSENKEDWQPLLDHLNQVKELTGDFAQGFCAKEWGELVGWFHDLGKYSESFQNRLNGSPHQVDHATAGAQWLRNNWKSVLALIPAYAIAGHHAGLSDYGTAAGEDSCLARRLTKEIEPYSDALSYINFSVYPKRLPFTLDMDPGLQLSLFIRMLFSCLIDADSLDSERFEAPQEAAFRGHEFSFAVKYKAFEDYMKQNFSVKRSPVDGIRTELLEECLAQAEEAPGLRTLTLPTGSGKTLISLGYALKHASIYKTMRRIIYVIPYTSIIEQNAEKFREVLGKECVLEHHSNVRRESEDSEDYPNLNKKMEKAEENWDYPVIVTTNVQFLESLYGNKRSRCRKLHRIANSVIIFDEAQMMNGDFFRPSMLAIEELTRHYGCTVLLCTATQPEVQPLFPKPIQVKELVQNVELRFEQFERVNLTSLGVLGIEELASGAIEHKQVLFVVNTRKVARELYDRCLTVKEADEVFHLSARMCPRHRSERLKMIRKRLDAGSSCCLISTQLIECGVDVDFPVVYREMAGLDSIAQAAGRCNRNGKLLPEKGQVFIYENKEGVPKGWFSTTASVTREILRRYPNEALSLKAVQEYFRELYCYQKTGTTDRTDKHNILKLLNDRAPKLEFPFRKVAELFQLIDTAAQPVIIPYDSTAEHLLEQLRFVPELRSIIRELQPYVVQLYPNEFKAFQSAREVEEVCEGIWKLRNPEHWYSKDIGVIPYSAEHHAAECLII